MLLMLALVRLGKEESPSLFEESTSSVNQPEDTKANAQPNAETTKLMLMTVRMRMWMMVTTNKDSMPP